MRTLLALMFLVGFECVISAQQAYHFQAEDLTHADVDFFFTSISLKNGETQFELSPNTMGMLWRIKSDKIDNTGACQSGQILTIPASTSLEIKRKDLNLYFLPRGLGSFNVRIIIKPEAGTSDQTESREATFLKVRSDGTYGIYIAKD